jgi:tetratricopeptide (TPR) repeat protein
LSVGPTIDPALAALDTPTLLETARQLREQGHLAVVVNLLTLVLGRDGRNAEAWHEFGLAANQAGQPERALDYLSRAIAIRPEASETHLAHGNALLALGRHEAARAAFEQALSLDPACVAAHFNRGNVLRALGLIDAAIASYDAAIALQPDMAIAHHNRAFCLLQKGDLAAGFEEYEWRRRCPTFEDPRYGLDRLWTGDQPLAGRTLFIWPELFQGDLIQFCRYAVLAERKGARVALAAPETMHRLLSSLSPTIQLLPAQATPPDFELQTPLMSLPRAFGAIQESLPGVDAYLRAEPERVARWRAAIGTEGFKIGVVWQGSTQPYALPLQRSYPLAALRGIASLEGVRLISLQKVNGLDQLDGLPDGMVVESLGDGFDPGPAAFVDTAAAMACCDLVITMDTSVAHLAGALGARTWVALPLVADWRWFTDRADSPWYPHTRLFRQAERGVWDGVFVEMAAALRGEPGL